MPRKRGQVYKDRLNALLMKAFDSAHPPTVRGPKTAEWDVSGRCEAPRRFTLTGRRDSRQREQYRYRWDPEGRYDLDMTVRCRKCRACLRQKAKAWASRAQTELRAAARTWFVSLTLTPENHQRIADEVRLRLSKGGTDFDCLSEAEQFAERHQAISPLVTKFLKRLRKGSAGDGGRTSFDPAQIRYLCIVEPHKEKRFGGQNYGLPHYHLFVHESDPQRHLPKRALQENWSFGFSSCKLVDLLSHSVDQSARYITKYIVKESCARVRASLDYGNPPLGITKCGEKKDPERETPFGLSSGDAISGVSDGLSNTRKSKRATVRVSGPVDATGSEATKFWRRRAARAEATAGAAAADKLADASGLFRR